MALVSRSSDHWLLEKKAKLIGRKAAVLEKKEQMRKVKKKERSKRKNTKRVKNW